MNFEVGEFAKIKGIKNCSHNFLPNTIVEIKEIMNDKLMCFGLTKYENYHFEIQSVFENEIEKCTCDNSSELNYVPVMELLLINNSVDESFGAYDIFAKTYKITNEQLDTVFKYAKNNNFKSVKWDCEDTEEQELFYENVFEIVTEYDESKIDYINVNTGGTIDIQFAYYLKYTSDDKVADFYLSKDNDNNDFPRGYISFYLMKFDDYLKTKETRIDLKKFMKQN